MAISPVRPGVAAEEAPQRVPVAAVPLAPAVAGKIAHVIQAGGVPGLRDQRRAGQRLLDGPGAGRLRKRRTVAAADEHAGQVEAEAIHVPLLGPDAQGLGQHLRDQRVIGIDGVAAAGVVPVGRRRPDGRTRRA